MSATPEMHYDWGESANVKVKEVFSDDAPEPLGKHMFTIRYHDDNLHHITITSRLVTRVLYFVNKTPEEYDSKKQSAVETNACTSEQSSTRTCVKKIVDVRITLRFLGVYLRKKI